MKYAKVNILNILLNSDMKYSPLYNIKLKINMVLILTYINEIYSLFYSICHLISEMAFIALGSLLRWQVSTGKIFAKFNCETSLFIEV